MSPTYQGQTYENESRYLQKKIMLNSADNASRKGLIYYWVGYLWSVDGSYVDRCIGYHEIDRIGAIVMYVSKLPTLINMDVLEVLNQEQKSSSALSKSFTKEIYLQLYKRCIKLASHFLEDAVLLPRGNTSNQRCCCASCSRFRICRSSIVREEGTL